MSVAQVSDRMPRGVPVQPGGCAGYGPLAPGEHAAVRQLPGLRHGERAQLRGRGLRHPAGAALLPGRQAWLAGRFLQKKSLYHK